MYGEIVFRTCSNKAFFAPLQQNINLVTDEHREPITCKMLDMDTITQAKEKALDAIYMNTPNTRRPNVHDVDLGG